MSGVVENVCPSSKQQKRVKLIQIKKEKERFCLLTLWLADLFLNPFRFRLSLSALVISCFA